MLKKIASRLLNRKPLFLRGKTISGRAAFGRALLYYKTDSLHRPSLARRYHHTNDWEVVEIVRILTSLGFRVDVVDRDFDPAGFRPGDDYDLFIGLGAGNSGKHFPYLARRLPKAIKIFYAAGPHPTESNRLILDRYALFERRHPGVKLSLRRMIDKVDVEAALGATDAIFAVANEFSLATYRPAGKPVYPIYPSTSPALGLSLGDLASRKTTSFVYFGGNGHVVKGLDLLVEAFAGRPGLKLHVCAPEDEHDFKDFYRDMLARSPNIKIHGFVTIGSRRFHEIVEECGFVLLPSCSEGIATSVVTCMRTGLIPVVTREAGVDTGDFGVNLTSLQIPSLQDTFDALARMPRDEFVDRSLKSFSASRRYTQGGFTECFESAVVDVLRRHGRLPRTAAEHEVRS